MKKTFKYSIALAAFFAAALVSGTSSYAQNLEDGTYLEKDGIAYRKAATHNPDGSYTIDLETFVTGKVTYTEEATPSDIILVLDVSGSMNETINSYEYNKATVSSITGESLSRGFYDYNNSEATAYYYKEGEDDYYQVYIGHAQSGGIFNRTHYFFLYYTVNGTRKYINNAGQVVNQRPTNVTNSTTNLLHSSVTLYTRTQSSSTTKIEALRKAVNAFIDAVHENDIKDKHGQTRPTPLNNQIAIVKFAADRYCNDRGTEMGQPYNYDGQYSNIITPGNHRGAKGNSNYNYTEVLAGFTSTTTESTTDGTGYLKGRVTAINEGGATAANFGMTKAKYLLASLGEDRANTAKTVVLFTDGVPGTSGWDTDFANETISVAKEIKNTYGANVFTVGVFNDLGDDETNVNNYMNYVSSNYPSAESMTNPGTKDANGDFYKDASGGAADLSEIFIAIAGSAASQNATIGNSSIVTVDVVSSSFSVPANAEDAELEILVAKCNGKTNIGGKEYLTFEDPISPGEAGFEITPVFKPEENTVSTSGFDFSANFCGPDESTTPISYRGYKQIIRFKINVKEDAVGGPAVATNDKESGIYIDDPDNPGQKKQIAEFNRPTVKVPVSIWIQKVGLDDEDSAVFTIYGSPFEGFNTSDPESNTWYNITKIIYNKDSAVKITDEQGNEVWVVKKTGLDPDFYYKIKEDAWAFGYQYQDNGIVYTVGDNIKNPFVITNTPKNTVFDEAVHRNIFNKKDQ